MTPENPWITWEGGECPVDRQQRVEICLRNGEPRPVSVALAYRWSHLPEVDPAYGYDIIAYRVVSA